MEKRTLSTAAKLQGKSQGYLLYDHVSFHTSSELQTPIDPNFLAELQPLGLNERLSRLVQHYPDKYSQDVIRRVRQFVQFETENPNKGKPYKLFQTVDDFDLYHKIHPEWQGKTSKQMVKGVEPGSRAFVSAFYNYIHKEAVGDYVIKYFLARRIFNFHQDRRIPEVPLDYWINEFQQHPEWQGKSQEELSKDEKFGGAVFYSSFINWVGEISGKNRRLKRELMRKIFPSSHSNYAHFTNIEDWIHEQNKHPKWQGKSKNRMINDPEDPEAKEFVRSFDDWVKNEVKDDTEKKKNLVDRVFHTRRLTSRRTLIDIKDWQVEFQKHPEWQGRRPQEMLRDKKSGARAYYASFIIWLNKTAKNNEERVRYLKNIFPDMRIIMSKTQKAKEQEIPPIFPEEAWRVIDALFE